MSSNQWETVTKSRKQKNLEKKVEAHVEKKRLAAVPVKLEEIVSSQQYHNIISGKDKKSPAKANGTGGGGATQKKSPTKKPAKAAAASTSTAKQESGDGGKKQQQPPQPKAPPKPKSPEAALRQITPEDFSAHLEQLKLTFPGSELLWLKGVASYLNMALPFDCDPTFAGKSVHYPSVLLTPHLKSAMVKFLDDMGTVNLQYFYHTLLDSMAIEMSKNMTVFGYKLLLQLIGKNWPEMCSGNLAKSALLRNSYQNRSNICLSILWAVGQGGYERLMEGVKVWQNLMLPNLEMKSYTKYIADYIEKVLTSSSNQELTFNQNEFFLTYNALKASYSISKENQETLRRASEVFLLAYISSSTKHANIFLALFRDIQNAVKNRIEIIGCIKCLDKSKDCFKVWKMNYKKQVVPSILLMRGVEQEWNDVAERLRSSKEFHEFLNYTKVLNAEMEAAKRRDENLHELLEMIVAISEKSAQQKKKQAAEEKKSCRGCKWTFGIILVIILIGVTLAYDTNVNGKGVFARSATGKALQKAGLLPYVETAWYTTMSASARGYKWAEQNVPPYAKPVMKLACDMYKLSRNLVCNACTKTQELFVAKWPVVAKFIDQYIPDLSVKLENFCGEVKKTIIDLSGKGVTFLNTQVFVGRLSPENMSKALNDTTNIAAEYYSLFHKKVDMYAKLK